MISTLIISHGQLATELLAAARKIVGELPELAALSLDWDCELESVSQQIRQAVVQIDHGDGVLILVDVFGGTPYNGALRLLCTEKEQEEENGVACGIELVAGVNLPMVLRIGCLTDKEIGLRQAAEWLSAKGQGSICVAKLPKEATATSPDEPRLDPCL